jgi:hypothetical protein
MVIFLPSSVVSAWSRGLLGAGLGLAAALLVLGLAVPCAAAKTLKDPKMAMARKVDVARFTNASRQ